MFQIRALGHHGWLFRTATTTLAVDPLLGPRFAFTPHLVVWPERALAPDQFPKLDAIFLTHEHEGHFDPFTLSLLPRDTPVWIPSRSSGAMQRAIEEMGFSVRRARAGAPIVVGDIELFPIAGDHTSAAIEEWDLLAYTVRDLAGEGSFFTHVDLRLTDVMRDQVLARLGRPGLLAITGNEHQYTFQTSWRAPDPGAAAALARDMTEEHRWFEERGAAPAGLLLVGGGWAFEGPIAWLNGNAFHVDLDGVARAVAALLPRSLVAWAKPGDAWTFVDGRLVQASAADVGVGPAPATSREFVGDVKWLEDYTPACGRTTITDAELGSLREELARFAAALYASHTFRTLHSLQEAELGDRDATFALVLRADDQGGAYVFAYSSQECAFVPVDCLAPTERYLAVYECWATDLLDNFLVRQSQNALAFGRSRTWNAAPDRFPFNLTRELFVYTHPLRFPERFLDLYRRLTPASARSARVDDLHPIGEHPGPTVGESAASRLCHTDRREREKDGPTHDRR
jgi:L-ascorbate metabolism protein UlaG (beta-lactamase superfamily)